MTIHDGVSDIKIVEDGREASYSLEHLWDLIVTIPNFHFEDGRTDTVEVFVRPTNHVYSRALKPEEDRQVLEQSGRLIIRYEHHEGAPNKIKKGDDGNPMVSSDVRAFCEEKYESSLNIPTFAKALESSPSKLCVLANRDDDRSCLTALFEFDHGPQQKECFVVIFKLHKLSARQLSMVLETAFLIDGDDFRVHLLNSKDKGKPFFVIANNVFANRKPFEGKAKKRAKKSYKKATPKMKKPRQKGEVSNSSSEIPISGLPSYLCLAERWHLNRQLTHQYSYPAGGRVSRSVKLRNPNDPALTVGNDKTFRMLMWYDQLIFY